MGFRCGVRLFFFGCLCVFLSWVFSVLGCAWFVVFLGGVWVLVGGCWGGGWFVLWLLFGGWLICWVGVWLFAFFGGVCVVGVVGF